MVIVSVTSIQAKNRHLSPTHRQSIERTKQMTRMQTFLMWKMKVSVMPKISNPSLFYPQGKAENRRKPVNGVERGSGSLCWGRRSTHDLSHVDQGGPESGSLHVSQTNALHNLITWSNILSLSNVSHCVFNDWNCSPFLMCTQMLH